MPKGVYERSQGSAMTAEELNEAEARVADKISPLPKPKAAPAREVVREDGTVRKSVGVFTSPAKIGDNGTLKHFKHTPADRTGWIEMSFEEMAEYEAQGILVGYCAEEGLGLIKRRKQ